jgi:hypothetical protein
MRKLFILGSCVLALSFGKAGIQASPTKPNAPTTKTAKTETTKTATVTGKDADAAALEREKALKNPYPNDFGPAEIKDLSGYSAEEKAGYKLLQTRCTVCHTASRPLNSQFVDLKEPELGNLKKAHPELFKDKLVWQIESGIWQRYVKRMMAKPGCSISSPEGKKIFNFLVAYSTKEKLGSSMGKWEKHRKKLLADFKKEYPEKYKELFEE